MLEICISILGLLISFICFFVMFFANKKKKVVYDELQTQYRNKAYKISFFTLIAYSIINSILDIFDIHIFKNYITISAIGIIISIFVFSLITIKNSSYIALKETLKLKTLLIFILGFINVIIGIILIIKNLIIENNQITFNIVYLFSGILFMFLALFILIVENKKKLEEEEETL